MRRGNSRLIMLAVLFIAISILSLSLYGCSKTSNPDNSTLINIEYTPMQCETSPWNAWLANSSIRFIRAPTEPEIITMFYGQENITLTDIQTVKTADVVCEACGVCNKGYKITAKLESIYIQTMIGTGWKKV